MNTPTHLLLGLAAFGAADTGKRNVAALVGAFLPDAALFVLYFIERVLLGYSDQVIFREHYWTPAWQIPSAIGNSVFLWLLVALLVWRFGPRWLLALPLAALLHIAFDLPVHNHDAHRHFWPLTDWRFISPVSYWDSRHHGNIVQVIEVAGAAVICLWLLRRHSSRWLKTLCGLSLLSYLGVAAYWAYRFG